MKKILLFAVLAMIGCINSPDQSPIYLSAEIKEGNSWRYVYEYINVWKKIIYSDISVDSVWSDTNDNLFFFVTKVDSILQETPTDDSLVIDSSIVVTPNILCKKTGIKTICSDDLLSRLFSDQEYVQYDNVNNVSRFDTNYSHMINIQFGEKCFRAVDIYTHTMTGLSNGVSVYMSTHTLFADTIGIISDTYSYGGGRMIPRSTSLDLLKFNGNDFWYTTTSSSE